MKAFFRSMITIAAMVGLVFSATLALAGVSNHAGGATNTHVVLPMPTPDPNPQAEP